MALPRENIRKCMPSSAGSPPDDIRRLLRLDLVETESGAVDIHIGNQRYPIFLLDQTGSQAASFFAASTEAEYLLRIQQALKTRTDRARSKRKELLQECAELEAALEHFSPLTALESDLTAAEARSLSSPIPLRKRVDTLSWR